MNTQVKMLVVDFPAGTYTMTIGDTTQTTVIRSKGSAQKVADLLKHRGFSIQIVRGKLPKRGTPMALTPQQQQEVDFNHFRALAMLLDDPTAKIHAQTLRAMQRRRFVDFSNPPAITDDGGRFYEAYGEQHPDAMATVNAELEAKQEPPTTPAATDKPRNVKPARSHGIDDEAREVILSLRSTLISLGRKLAADHSDELVHIFDAIQRSDRLLLRGKD